MIRVLWFDSQWRLGIFIFTTMSTTALGPIHSPIQWVLGAPSLGVKWLHAKVTTHLPLMLR